MGFSAMFFSPFFGGGLGSPSKKIDLDQGYAVKCSGFLVAKDWMLPKRR
jgi:hypothetical protein